VFSGEDCSKEAWETVVEDKLKKMAAAGRELRAGVGAAAAAAALLLAW
jgi:hypothetical protein